MDNNEREKYLNILKEELLPALGCTEPIALAYAASKCREILGQEAEVIEAECSANIIKNVKAVVVPNCGGMKGIETAVVAGMLFGDASKNLEVLENIDESKISSIKKYIETHEVKVSLLETNAKLHFIIKMSCGSESALIEVVHQHTNIVRIEKNGELIYKEDFSENDINDNLTDRTSMTVAGIIDFAENIELAKIKEIIKPQIECNIAICKEGLSNQWGAEVGKTIIVDPFVNVASAAAATAAAGSDARMSGCSLPVIINSGSGNQGITVSVPVIVYANSKNVGEEKLIRALALSNLLAIHQKTLIGRLSAYCGVVCAACGSGAAITWLDGGGEKEIDDTIVNTLATISGMICDGAKPSCAGKIAVAVNAAYIAHEMAMRNRVYHSGEGIVKQNVEETVSGIGEIASNGMRDTDKVILDVMLDNN